MTKKPIEGALLSRSIISLPPSVIDLMTKRVVTEIKALVEDNLEPEIGSVLYCSLAVFLEHTGIYVGNGEVVHLNGDGFIEKVSFDEFVGRLDGMNVTFAICCPVDNDNQPIGDNQVAERALSLVGTCRDYNLLLDNCHKFTFYCLTGKSLEIGTFQVVEKALREKYDFRNWQPISWLNL